MKQVYVVYYCPNPLDSPMIRIIGVFEDITNARSCFLSLPPDCHPCLVSSSLHPSYSVAALLTWLNL